MKPGISDIVVYAFLAGLVVFYAVDSKADQFTEYRYCGQPARDAKGEIIRSSKVRQAFKNAVPCPSSGLSTGACPGWSIDHVWPLDSCGCDSVSNMQWLKNTIKSCAGTECKDRWERSVYKCKGG